MSKSMVVSFPGNAGEWPAFEDTGGIIVDLRTNDRGRMVYKPLDLLRRGVPLTYVAAAANSQPPGFALLKGEADV